MPVYVKSLTLAALGLVFFSSQDALWAQATQSEQVVGATDKEEALQEVDRVVAVIENEIITLRELKIKAQPFLSEIRERGDARKEAEDEVLRKVLDAEIGERILDSEIEKSRDRLGVTDKDVDRAIEEVLRINKINKEQLEAALYGQGMTWSEYRKKLLSQIERSRLVQYSLQGRVKVREDDVRSLCRERRAVGGEKKVCAGHILLRTPAGGDEAQTMAQAQQIYDKLQAGADFSAMVKAHSVDRSSEDGSLGCFGRGEMVDAFEKAAFATKPGSISKPVKTSFGVHVIKVFEHQLANDPCANDEALAPFRNEIYQKEMEREMGNWVLELRKQSYVEIKL